MVFLNEEWNNTGDIVVYSNYHKYWLDRERKIKNPLFDVFSGRILDLKEGKQTAINYFYNEQNLLTSWHGEDGETNRFIWKQFLLLKIWILRITSFC